MFMRGYDPSAIPDRDPDQETLALSICKSCSVLLAFCDLADAEAAVDQLAAVSAHHAWVISDVWLLWLRALLARAQGDDTA